MLSDKMVERLNEQLNKEMYSAYFYMAMSAYAASCGLNGIANWFNVQVQEELFHSKKFYDYINQQGGAVHLKAIEEPPQDFSSILDLFRKTLEHEKGVTKRITDLVFVTRDEKDLATEAFLQWFVSEQVEEEDSVSTILQQLELIKGEGNGLFMLDKELSQRTFTPPQTEE